MSKQSHRFTALSSLSSLLCVLGAAACSGGSSADGADPASTAGGSGGSAGKARNCAPKGERSSGAALSQRPNPRLLLNDALLARLRQRAAAGDPAWLELEKQCDEFSTAQVEKPNGKDYPPKPNIGEGYQGDEYLPAMRAIALCYQTVRGVDAEAEARYGQTGLRLLDAISTPEAEGGLPPKTNSGYPIRHYAVAMALGYDWLYPLLDAGRRQRVIATLNTWIDWYDANGFVRNDPIANYFTGYLLGKAWGALATEGENPKAPAYWEDVSTRLWGELVKPELQVSMAGGGWPEGWNYGKKAVMSIAETMWAANTAKGLEWWKELPQLAEQARYVQQFAWPSLAHMDDQGTIRSNMTPKPSAELTSGLATVLYASGDPYADEARGFAREVIATSGDDRRPWAKFLYDDPAEPAAPNTAPLSYLAPGPSHVAMRSSWDRDAVWSAFSGGPYINAPDSGEQMFNSGSLSVVVGDQPLLVNPTGWIPQQAGVEGERFVYEDTLGHRQRRLFNTFYVDDASNPYNPGQNNFSRENSKAQMDVYEDGGGYVRARAVHLEDQYGWRNGSHPVQAWTRDLLYLRPGTFLVSDRTTVTEPSADRWLSFHTAAAPTQSAAASGAQRFTVPGGSIESLLPATQVKTVPLPANVHRLELHAAAGAPSQHWLTMIRAGDGSGAVRLSNNDGNVTAGDAVGVHLPGAQEQVALFAAPGSTQVSYSVQQAGSAEHVIADLAPAAEGYSVSATPNGSGLTVQVSPGGSFAPSAAGVLALRVEANGAVTPVTPVTPVADPADTPQPGATPTVPGVYDPSSPRRQQPLSPNGGEEPAGEGTGTSSDECD